MSLRGKAAPRVALFAAAMVLLAVVAFTVAQDDTPAEPVSPLVCEDDAASEISPLFGAAVENVALTSMERRPVMLHDLAGEKFTTVIFCSYRCPCSDGYIDRLQQLRTRYEPRGVRFVAIHANSDETMEGMSGYIQRKEYPLPVYRDDMTAAADMMQATVTPEVFVFDPDWMLRYHGRIDDDKSGFFVEEESLRLALDTLLSGRDLLHREKISLGCAITRDIPSASD